jgi:hypothetical protein
MCHISLIRSVIRTGRHTVVRTRDIRTFRTRSQPPRPKRFHTHHRERIGKASLQHVRGHIRRPELRIRERPHCQASHLPVGVACRAPDRRIVKGLGRYQRFQGKTAHAGIVTGVWQTDRSRPVSGLNPRPHGQCSQSLQNGLRRRTQRSMKPNGRFEPLRHSESIGSQLASRHQIQKRLIGSFDCRGTRIRQAPDRFTQHGSDVRIGLLHQFRNKSSGRLVE